MPGKPPSQINPFPLLTHCATLMLGVLCQDAEVFEFGAGGSTLWLASRAKRLVSIEHDADWYAVIAQELGDEQPHVSLRLVELPQLAHAISKTRKKWDVVFVDCNSHHREQAIKNSAAHVKPGGWLVADDFRFPGVKRAVNALRAAHWSIEIMAGVKLHPLRKVPVDTAIAFCRKPEA